LRAVIKITIAATLSLIGIVAALILLGPLIGQQFQTRLGPSCATLYIDDNGNGRYNSGESIQTSLNGAEIVITRADNDLVLVRLPATTCLVPQSAHNLTINVTLILPAGYSTSTPQRTIVVQDYIEDYPTQYFDISVAR